MPAGGGRRKISLEAVFKTTCSKCGVMGHLAKDCFQSASGKVYELIPEEDIADLQPNLQTAVINPDQIPKSENKRKKKHKKDKKKKKKSSSSPLESDSDSSDQRDRRKHKKRHRSRSESPMKKKKHR